MPKWSDLNTGRLVVKVFGNGHAHYTKARLPFNATADQILDGQVRLQGAYSKWGFALPSDFAALEVKWYPYGQVGGLVQPLIGTWENINGMAIPAARNTAKYVNFVGKGTGRGSCSIKIWGISHVAGEAQDDDFRETGDETPAVALTKAALDGISPLFVCRDGSQAVFSTTALSRVSAYWQTKLRQ